MSKTWVGPSGAPIRIPGGVGSYFVSRDGEHFREYRKTATVKAIRMEGPFEVETTEGLMSGVAGDYLCEGPAGEIWPIKRAIFEATYQPVAPSEERA